MFMQQKPRYILILPSGDHIYEDMISKESDETKEIAWAEYKEFKQVNIDQGRIKLQLSRLNKLCLLMVY